MDITILSARGDRTLTKTIRRENGEWVKSDYDDCRTYTWMTAPVGSIHELHELLVTLAECRDSCIVRGRVIDSEREVIERRYHGRYNAEMQYEAPFMEPQPSEWLCVDMDKLAAPAGLATVEDRVRWLRDQLPAEFRDTTCVYQWSSSAGVDGWDVLSAHLWFWLSEPVDDVTLKERARHEGWPVDRSLWQPVQPHYTASPIFCPATLDPLCEGRVGLLQGSMDVVTLPEWVPPPRPVRTITERMDARCVTETGGTSALESLIAEIGSPTYHEAIRRVVAHYIATTIEPDDEWIIDRIMDAAGHGRSYVDRRYIENSIRGAKAKFAGTAQIYERSALRDARTILKQARKGRK